MKRIYSVFIAATLFLSGLQAQVDVTATYLQNAGFDDAPTIFTKDAGGKIANADTDYRITRVNGGTSPGWRFIVSNWDETSVINNNAVQISTAEYGFTTVPTSAASGLNTTTPPATQKDGVTATGACLHMSAGWGDRAIVSQAVKLPAGKYKLFYDAYNAHTSTGIAVNYSGYTVGTTSTFAKLNSVPQNTWKTDSVQFSVVNNLEDGIISIGFTTSTGSSGNGAKLYIDNVILKYYGIDKTDLKQLIDSATVLFSNQQPTGLPNAYTNLSTAITAAQAVYNNTMATVAQVLEQENALKEAIAEVHGGILLKNRIDTWTTFPYNATSAIINPSFESGFTGWSNTGPFQTQTNTSFDPYKVGTYYAERWISSGGSLSDIRLLQSVKYIPNGVYMLTASAHATQQAENSFPGGTYLSANTDFVEIFERKDYSVTTSVTDNTLNIGFEVFTTGNWVATDNYRLTYISDGRPYLIVTPENLNFTPSATSKIIKVKGGNLTNAVTLTAPAGFSLSATSIPAVDVMTEPGVDITVTYTGTSEITTDTLTITSGTTVIKVALSATQVVNARVAGLFYDLTLPESYTFKVTGDVFGDISLSAPNGVTLSTSSISPAAAADTVDVNVQWNLTSNIPDKYIYLSVGNVKKDSILVFAVTNNLIANWDGDNAEGEGSRLTDFGWTHTLADGVTPVGTTFNVYDATSAVRYVPYAKANHTYKGKPWIGHRIAYLRGWGSPATNVYNLPVMLEEGKTYKFRGVSAWHNNETNPTFTYSVNSAPANLGDTLGSQSVLCTVRQRGEDYSFEFKPKTTAVHYLTVSSNTVNDAMCAPEFLAIYEKPLNTATDNKSASSLKVYPTITSGNVQVDFGGKTGIIKVYDISGRIVSTKEAKNSIESVSLPTTGIYLMEVSAANETRTFKVLKM
jgi:hypothetical protein